MRVKVLSIFLLLVLIVSMTGCGTPDNDEIDEPLTPQEEEEYEDHEEIEGLINEDEDEDEDEEEISLNGITDSKHVTVTASNVNLRSGPGTKFDIVGSVDTGEKLEVVFFMEHWIKVETEDGSEAFIAGWLTDENLPEPDSEKLEEEKVDEEI